MIQKSNSLAQTLIISGMHRSGTSLTASLLASTGINLGQKLLQSNNSNQKGHFESIDFLDFHRNVLYSQGVSTDGWTLNKSITVPEQFLVEAKSIVQKNISQPVWGWKEPRTILFLDFWANLLPEAKFVFVYRSPWEVIDSLYRRGDPTFTNNPNFALQVWLNYNEIIRDFCDRFSSKCLLFKLEYIIKEPNILVTSIKDKFGITLKKVDNLYEEKLLHNEVASSHRPVLIKTYFPEAVALYQELDERAVNFKEFDNCSICEIDSFPSYSAWVFQDWLNLRLLETKLKDIKFNLNQTQNQLNQTQAMLIAMQGSKFWKLRNFWFRLKKVIGLPNND